MIQDTVVQTLLEASGNDRIYFKLHASEPKAAQYFLHWLADSCVHADAIALRDASTAVGLAFKRAGNGPKYGLRFASEAAFAHFCKENKLDEKCFWGRFKATNIRSSVGFIGLHDMLSPHGWEVQEVEYFGDGHVLFLASKNGTVDQMDWKNHAGRNMPVKIQAVNARAKAISQPASQASRAIGVLSSDARRTAQNEAVQKRTAPGKAGETPPRKQHKGGETQND